jgi:hypothetical protein
MWLRTAREQSWRLAQRVEHDLRQLPITDNIRPIPRELVGRVWRAVREREDETEGIRPPQPEQKVRFELLTAMLSRISTVDAGIARVR